VRGVFRETNVDLREKDTAIILFCCILVVLLVIFFLSERRKYTFDNIDASPEGSWDVYTLTVDAYEISGEERKRVSSARYRIERVVLYLGADRRGEMLVRVRSGENAGKGIVVDEVRPVDMSMEFLPEGSCRLPFFDSDLIRYRGDVVRQGERWKYVRPLAVYGGREFSTEVYYVFKGKERRGDRYVAQVEFAVAPRRWVQNGLNCIDRFQGVIFLDEETGKVDEMRFHFTTNSERGSTYVAGKMVRESSRVLSGARLAEVRRRCASSGPEKAAAVRPKKRMVSMMAQGTRRDINARLFSGRRSRGVYTLQLRAFPGSREGKRAALLLRDGLLKKGYAAFVVREGGMYKVCVGKYPERTDALRKRCEVLKRFFADAFIRRLALETR